MATIPGSYRRGAGTLAVASSVAASVSLGTRHYDRLTVYITGTFVATIDVQISADDTNWITIETLTAPGAVVTAIDTNYIRTKTTAYTSGAPAGYVIGSRS